MVIVEKDQQRAMKVVKGQEHISAEERMRELEQFSLQKRKLEGIHVYNKYLMGQRKVFFSDAR